MHLFVASYTGIVATLEFSKQDSGQYSLELIASSESCSPTPSYITLDPNRRILYCTEAGVKTGTGILFSLAIQPDGSLVTLHHLPVLTGAAHLVTYNQGCALGVAYYYAGEIGTYSISGSGHLKKLQSLSYSITTQSPDHIRNQSRPHQIIVDPSGDYMLVPDLGSDLVRILRISHYSKSSGEVKEQQVIQLPQGYAPRHGAFAKIANGIYFYILAQNSNKLIAYRVDYADEIIRFQELGETNLLLRKDGTTMSGAIMASEIVVSPDNRFLIISLRNDSSYTIRSYLDPEKQIPADSLITYHIDPANGRLKLLGGFPAGGSYPRHFSLNAAGDKLAVAIQTNGWVAIFERNIETGEITELLAVKGGLGEGKVACVIWDENK